VWHLHFANCRLQRMYTKQGTIFHRRFSTGDGVRMFPYSRKSIKISKSNNRYNATGSFFFRLRKPASAAGELYCRCQRFFFARTSSPSVGLTHTPFQLVPGSWFEASAAMLMKSAFFWDITQRRMVNLYRRLGKTCRSHLQRSRSPRRVPGYFPAGKSAKSWGQPLTST
jgi:hypothetical protein